MLPEVIRRVLRKMDIRKMDTRSRVGRRALRRVIHKMDIQLKMDTQRRMAIRMATRQELRTVPQTMLLIMIRRAERRG
jgi:hypothetical protein